MTGLNMMLIALGGFTFASVLPLAASAHSGDALVHAETVCLEQGVGPNSIPFETCVTRAAQAYELGRPDVAVAEARKVSAASKACIANDIEPMTKEFRECMAAETSKVTISHYETR